MPAEASVASKPATSEMAYRDAICLALEHEMEADPTVLLLGEDVGDAGGPFKTSPGLLQRFGPDRVFDTPIAENCFVGVGIGLAVTGFRPVVEIMFADFLAVAMDSIVNEAAKYRFMSGGKFRVPLTIRAIGGGKGRFGAQHSQTCESWFTGIPGLRVVAAATPQDAYGLLRSAIRDPNPVLILEHKGLFARKGPVTTGELGLVPLGSAQVKRSGRDVTVVATLYMVDRALSAAEELARDGIDAEIIDLRSLAPLDLATIQRSVQKTGRLVTVEEQPRAGGWGSSLVGRLTEEGMRWASPPLRVTLPDIPMPYSPVLEDAVIPSAGQIAAAVSSVSRPQAKVLGQMPAAAEQEGTSH
jgi:pyruvate dehydrogenase E1 component beta subunit